jgi:hypothetical protein
MAHDLTEAGFQAIGLTSRNPLDPKTRLPFKFGSLEPRLGIRFKGSHRGRFKREFSFIPAFYLNANFKTN